jgi:CBS-domain-containing membrane protein
MTTAKDIMCKRIVVGFPEERLAEMARKMALVSAQHCVVLDASQRSVLGLIRLTDVAARTFAGNRILSDLVSSVLPLTVQDTEPASEVAELFIEQGIYEAVVMSAAGTFVGLISAESAFAWLYQERQTAQHQVQQLQAERSRLGYGTPRSVGS